MNNKVLIFNGYYYPSKNCGGPITSIENIVNGCCHEFDFYIICYNHDFNSTTEFDIECNKWFKVGNANVMYVHDGEIDFSKKKIGKILDDLHPNLIWFSGVLKPNNKIATVFAARKRNIPVLFSPRGEVSADRVKLKSYKKIPYLNVLKLFKVYSGCYFHATSDDEERGILKYFSPNKDHLFKVANISILKQPDIIEHQKKKNELKLIFFSRIHEVKNLLFAIRCLSKCKMNITYDIYGPIESENYWNDCKVAIDLLPDNIKVNYRGLISREKMSSVIQKYDVFLFPTINENYGHVIAESLANSRPVILSKGTTPWDDLDNIAGYVIDLNNPDEFAKKIDYLAEMDNMQYQKLIDNTKEYFDKKTKMDGAIDGHIRMIKGVIKNGCSDR